MEIYFICAALAFVYGNIRRKQIARLLDKEPSVISVFIMSFLWPLYLCIWLYLSVSVSDLEKWRKQKIDKINSLTKKLDESDD